MRHRPQLVRHSAALVGLLFLFFSGKALLPAARPMAQTSLRVLALASVCSSQPQRTVQLWKEELLSNSLKSEEILPVVEAITEIPPLIQPESSPQIEETPPSQSLSEKESEPVTIPAEYQAPIIEETMSGQAKVGFPTYGAGLIKNSTQLSDEEVCQIASETHQLTLTSGGPQVLIYHTHATESFEPYDSTIYDTRNTWRSTDNAENMVAVGDALCAAIEAHGIGVIHDTTLHDYPSYNGSYERSAATIESYLQQYPSLCVALDIHRDAIQREDTLVKPVVTIEGKKAAQLMIVAGCDDSGSLGIPTWKNNLRFGARLQDQIEQLYPGLCRPLYFTYRKYNQHLTNASLLFEVGSHGNTLEEALYCAEMAGDAIGAYLAAQL